MPKTTISSTFQNSVVVSVSKEGNTNSQMYPVEFSYVDKQVGDRPYIVMTVNDFENVNKFIAQAKDALSKMA